MSDFQGIQGSGGEPAYEGLYTWGGDPAARIIVDTTAHKNELQGGPHGISLQAASKMGYYQARDGYDGQWLWVRAGEMVPLTAELIAAKDADPVASRAELRVLRGIAQALIVDIDRMLK